MNKITSGKNKLKTRVSADKCRYLDTRVSGAFLCFNSYDSYASPFTTSWLPLLAREVRSPMLMTRTRISLFLSAPIVMASLGYAQTASLLEPPQVRPKNHVSSLTLRAVNEDGRNAFAFDGRAAAPVIRAAPGDILRITYSNDLPPKSQEMCALQQCMNMT
ncbi:MAG TPA: hypothetical protein VGP65_01190, partial [Candidatus Angelobacter sp.]|nr:hypothetical protein [Candidatus Angelobacter sp.]